MFWVDDSTRGVSILEHVNLGTGQVNPIYNFGGKARTIADVRAVDGRVAFATLQVGREGVHMAVMTAAYDGSGLATITSGSLDFKRDCGSYVSLLGMTADGKVVISSGGRNRTSPGCFGRSNSDFSSVDVYGAFTASSSSKRNVLQSDGPIDNRKFVDNLVVDGDVAGNQLVAITPTTAYQANLDSGARANYLRAMHGSQFDLASVDPAGRVLLSELRVVTHKRRVHHKRVTRIKKMSTLVRIFDRPLDPTSGRTIFAASGGSAQAQFCGTRVVRAAAPLYKHKILLPSVIDEVNSNGGVLAHVVPLTALGVAVGDCTQDYQLMVDLARRKLRLDLFPFS